VGECKKKEEDVRIEKEEDIKDNTIFGTMDEILRKKRLNKLLFFAIHEKRHVSYQAENFVFFLCLTF
jgi:hypothetical protein